LATGSVNRVPVLHGINHDEEHGRFGAQEVITGARTTEADYRAELVKTFGDEAGSVFAAYSDVQPDSPSPRCSPTTHGLYRRQ
jgi:para-nitrobenzyl esterase